VRPRPGTSSSSSYSAGDSDGESLLSHQSAPKKEIGKRRTAADSGRS